MLSVVGGMDSDSELSKNLHEDRTGEGILSCLQRHKKTGPINSKDKLPDFLHGSTSIQVGVPALIHDYDAKDETVVFVYDPEQTPTPKMTLRNGITIGEKLLFMDGELVVHFANAASLKIGEINVIENGLLV